MSNVQPVLERAVRWADRQSDRINPIVIRETRRALHGKAFIATFLILLGLCAIMSMTMLSGRKTAEGLGRNIFATLHLSLCAVTFFGLPSIIPSLVRTEVRDRTFEMLRITALSSIRIVTGEMLAALGLFALTACAVTPFMAFSYILGGIALTDILIGMAYVLIPSMELTAIAIAVTILGTPEAVVRIGMTILALCVFAMSIGQMAFPYGGFGAPGMLFYIGLLLGAIAFFVTVSFLSGTHRSRPARMENVS